MVGNEGKVATPGELIDRQQSRGVCFCAKAIRDVGGKLNKTRRCAASTPQRCLSLVTRCLVAGRRYMAVGPPGTDPRTR